MNLRQQVPVSPPRHEMISDGSTSNDAEVGTSDSLTAAVVTMIVPELRVGNILGRFWQGKPKNAVPDIKFSSRSVSFQLDVKTKKNAIKYEYFVKKLPGEIKPDDCIAKFYNGKVVLILAKAEEESWEATLDSRGLDQEY